MLRTPLYAFHTARQAKMVDFAGWEMPIMYGGEGGGIIAEHVQTRTSGGLFDVSHMGRVRISGRHARRLLERVCSRRISDMQAGQCRYSLACNERGGVHDDIIVYRFDDDLFTVVVNASNREKMLGHFERVRSSGDLTVKIEDETQKTAMVALQGPKVMDLVGRFSREIPTLKRYRFAVKNLVVAKLVVSRTGYTGEDGVEVILPAMMVDMALKLILKDAGMDDPNGIVKPAGLGCRDTLRMEAGMPLYGHELGEEINALSCGVDFAISLDKDQDDRGEPFVGMEALKKTRDEGGPARKLVGIALDGKRSARQGMKILAEGREVGEVSSGCLSPTLGYPIAMGFVSRDLAVEGTPVEVDSGRDFKISGKVRKIPFYSPTKGV
ncbi:MAG TPA: glycine cleavage system aminomethyltransferase GcvT [Phycisphaerales bacterium]|nr:glycine cleavage system aminomethyltransferase GcvT [Phycisphaerales bacterium]